MKRRQFLSASISGTAAIGLGGLLWNKRKEKPWIDIQIENLTLDPLPVRVTITEDSFIPFFNDMVFQETYETQPKWSPLTDGRDHMIIEEEAFKAANGDKFVISANLIDNRRESFYFEISCTDYQYEAYTVHIHQNDGDSQFEYSLDFTKSCPPTPMDPPPAG